MWSLDGSTSIIGTEKVFRIFIIIFLLKSLIGFFLRWWRLDCHPFQTIMSIQHCEYQQNVTNCPIFLDIPFARGKKLKKQHVVQVYFGWRDALPKGELCCRLCRAASPLWARSCRALWGQPGSRSYKKVCLPCHLTTWNCTSRPVWIAHCSTFRGAEPILKAAKLASVAPLLQVPAVASSLETTAAGTGDAK